MSQIESRLKSVLVAYIKGGWPPIELEDQKTLARWATMLTMVLEFADINTLATPVSHRDAFRLTLEPPPAWTIWVGHLNGNKWRGTFNHFGWNSHPTIIPDTLSARAAALTGPNDTQSTAFAVGNMFFQTYSTVGGLNLQNVKAVPERFGVRQLWPVADATITPPSKILSDLEADRLSSSFVPLLPPHLIRRAWDAPGKRGFLHR
jgi:hypothetical protein